MNGRVLLRVTLLIWLGTLFALFGVQRFLLDPLPMPTNLVVFAVQVAPVLAVIVALARNSPRATFWASLVSMPYFAHGIVLVVTPATRIMGFIEVAAALAVFVSALHSMRSERNPWSK